MDINLDELDIANRTALEIQIAQKTGHNNNTALIEFILRLLNGSSIGIPLQNATYVNTTVTFDEDDSVNVLQGTVLDVYIAFILITSIVGILGNITVLAVSFQGSKRLNNCRFLVAHLAFCDALFAVMQLFRVGPHFSNDSEWTFGTAGCKVIRGSILLGSLVGISTILIIALERYRGIVLTMSGRIRRRYLLMALAGVWIISLLVGLPPVVFLKINSSTGQCEEDWGDAPRWTSQAYAMFLLVGFFLLPLAIMVFLYGSMIRLLSQPLTSKSRGEVNITDYYVKRRRQEDLRVVKILILVVLMFFVCVLPIRLFWVIMEFHDGLSLDTYKTLFFFGLLPYPFHVAVNPLIYGVVDFKFRKRVRRLLKSIGKRLSYGCAKDGDGKYPSSAGEMTSDTSTISKPVNRQSFTSHAMKPDEVRYVHSGSINAGSDVKVVPSDSEKSSDNDSDADARPPPYTDGNSEQVIVPYTLAMDMSVKSHQTDMDADTWEHPYELTGLDNLGASIDEDSIHV